jgi:hypothetical protein
MRGATFARLGGAGQKGCVGEGAAAADDAPNNNVETRPRSLPSIEANSATRRVRRLRDTSSPVDELVSKHGGFEKFIGAFFFDIKNEYFGKHAQLESLIKTSRKYAREVEKLAPTIDRVCAPENAELESCRWPHRVWFSAGAVRQGVWRWKICRESGNP